MGNNYIVKGNHLGNKIKEKVEAVNSKQAKLKAGFQAGFGGSLLTGFMNNSKIKVKRTR